MGYVLTLTTVQSAIMAGFKVVPVKALADGSLDVDDLASKAKQYKDNLAAFMVRREITLVPQRSC